MEFFIVIDVSYDWPLVLVKVPVATGWLNVINTISVTRQNLDVAFVQIFRIRHNFVMFRREVYFVSEPATVECANCGTMYLRGKKCFICYPDQDNPEEE
jgi:ribosomal protein L32